MIDTQADLATQLGPSWYVELRDELDAPYFKELLSFVQQERKQGLEIFPPEEEVFSALKETPYSDTRVVIVGQDPYHGPGQAHGLSFSVQPGVPLPPSLRNIYKELGTDLKVPTPSHGCLLHWAKQGVLLLNATLTVRRGAPQSHAGRGWERFTDAVIEKLWLRPEPCIFILWGRHAQRKCETIMRMEAPSEHLVLRSAHPSPLSAHNGFVGSRPFSQCNRALMAWKQSPIDWSLPALSS